MVQHPAFRRWRAEHIDSIKYYDGEKGFTQQEHSLLVKNGITPVTCNFVAPNVNTILGIELQNEYNIKVQISSDDSEAKDCEDALNQYFYELQSKYDINTAQRRALRDALIGGLGFCNVKYVNAEPLVTYINPLNIVLDFNDETPDFSKQYCIYTWEDLDKTELQLRLSPADFAKLKFSDDYRQNRMDYNQTLSDSLGATQYYEGRLYTRHALEVHRGYRGKVSNGVLYFGQ